MIHKTAEISKNAKVGKNVSVWAFSQIREGAVIGDNCNIGRNVYIDHDIKIGSQVKIQNNALIYYQSVISNNVFIGPAAALINDKYPRATNISGKLKDNHEWKPGKIVVKKGASVGAGAIILPNVQIGSYCLVGAGAVVTRSTTDYSKVTGNPAKLAGYVCPAEHAVKILSGSKKSTKLFCPVCKKHFVSNKV